MFILCILSLVIADRVKIASRDSPAYILTLIGNAKGGSIRMMQESDIDNPTEQSGFELNGDKTELNNHGVIVCGNIWGSGISTCARDSSKKTVFNVIKTNTDVTFKTDGGDCLTMGDYDLDTKGYYLRLNRCDDNPSQKFKLVYMPKIDQTKTPLAPFPNESNANSQNNINDPCSNVNMAKTTSSQSQNTADGSLKNSISDPCSNVNIAKTLSASIPLTADGSPKNSISDPCSNVNMAKTTSAQSQNTADGSLKKSIPDPCSNVNMAKTLAASIPNTADGSPKNSIPDPCSNVNTAKTTSALIPLTADGSPKNSMSDPCSNVNIAKTLSASIPNTADGSPKNSISDPCSNVNMAKTGTNQSSNTANSQNNSASTSSNMNMPDIVFIPVSFEPNNISMLTEGSQFGNNINPFCFDANRLRSPTSFNSVYKFRRPAQPGNECNNHLQWTGVFRRYY